MTTILSDTDLINELRSLRSTLAPTFNRRALGILDEAAKRLAENIKNDNSATLAPKKPQQGNRVTKKDLMRKYMQCKQH